ncbi:hypothetical protein JCM10207_008664, partial [Rhodosporidiobolus poonsookiae]
AQSSSDVDSLIVNGVAPPSNPAIVPESLPITPALELSPPPAGAPPPPLPQDFSRIPSADKGKGRAAPSETPADSDDEHDDAEFAPSPSPTASDIERQIERWDPTQLHSYDGSDLVELMVELRRQLRRAYETESMTLPLIMRQVEDAEAVLRVKLGVPDDEELIFEGEEDESSDGSGEEEDSIPEGWEAGEEEGEIRMPAELSSEAEEDAPQDFDTADRSAFSDPEPEPEREASATAGVPDAQAIDFAVASMVSELVSQHTSGQPTSELFIPSSAVHIEPPTGDASFQREPGPQPDFRSRVELPLPPTETSVDAPLDSQVRNADESIDELIEEAEQASEVVPVGDGENLAQPSATGEQADGPAGPSEAGGLLVIDDDGDEDQAMHVAEQLDTEPPASSEPPVPLDSSDAAVDQPPIEPIFSAPSPITTSVDVVPPTAASTDFLPHAAPADAPAAEVQARQPSPSPEPDPIVPSHALHEPTLSSHFQREIGPEPDFASRVRLQLPPTVTREIDALDEDEEAQRDEERRRVSGENGDESRVVPLLDRLIDASARNMRQADDVDGGDVGDYGGMMVVDDDEPLEPAATAFTPSSPKPPTSSSPRKLVSATPPPADAQSSSDVDSLIVNGVAPPSNPAIVPESLPITPALELSPPPPSAPPRPPTLKQPALSIEQPSAETALPAPPPSVDTAGEDEIRFEDVVNLSEVEDDETSVDGDLSHDRDSRLASVEADQGGVLGLAAGEGFETAGPAALQESDDDDDDEFEVTPVSAEEVLLDGSEEDQLEAGSRLSETAPSSEPIDYRTEDEREIEERERAEENSDEELLISEAVYDADPIDLDEPPATLDPLPPSSPHVAIHDVVEPGEWHSGEPIRFGDSPAAQQPVDPAPEELEEDELEEDELEEGELEEGEVVDPASIIHDDLASPPLQAANNVVSLVAEVFRASEAPEEVVEEQEVAIEVEMDVEAGGEAADGPSEVQSVREASVVTQPELDSAVDIAFEILESAGTTPPPVLADVLEQAATELSELVEDAATAVVEDSAPSLEEPAPASPALLPPTEQVDELHEPATIDPHAPLQAVEAPQTLDFAPPTDAASLTEQGSNGFSVETSESFVEPVSHLGTTDVETDLAAEPAESNELLLDVANGLQDPLAVEASLPSAQTEDESDSSSDEDADEIVLASLLPHRSPQKAKEPSASPRRRSTRLPSAEADDQPTTPASGRRTRSAAAKEAAETASATPDLVEPAPSSPRRSSRLSLPAKSPAATPPPSSSKSKRARASDVADDPPAQSSPAKRTRRAGPSKLRDAASIDGEEDEAEPEPRVHHHHHPTASSSAGGSATVPVTRSRCNYQRIRICSKENSDVPPYLFNIPACALTSPLAQETMRAFSVEDLGPVDERDDCEGIPLGGRGLNADAAQRMEERHSALVPDADVESAVRRIVGAELWDEGVCEVVPREEVEKGRAKGGKGKKRAAEEAEEGGKGKRKR